MYSVFARIWLHDLAREAGHAMTLADVPDAALDRLAELGFDFVYLMGVWALGEAGPRLSRGEGACRSGDARKPSQVVADYDRALPGWTMDDVAGSPFAVVGYEVSASLGGDAALASLRKRLRERGIGLVLDFIPNHVAPDHPRVRERPELFVRDKAGRIQAGRDPYFPPWMDTVQLDYRVAATRAACIADLQAVARRCDGVRADMAMLVLDDVFRKTWSQLPPSTDDAKGEFWADAIDAVRAERPGFLFIAEAYWDLEWRLQLLGFDYTYDKSLYDRILHGSAPLLRGHLRAARDYQSRSVRFVENHDEARVAAVLPADHRGAAVVLAATVPGMRLFHDGQIEGRKVRANVHLARRAEEPVDPECVAFYEKLLAALRRPVLRRGSFELLTPREAGPGVPGWDAFIAYRWDGPASAIVVIVNFSPARATCRVTLDLPGLLGRTKQIDDLLSGKTYSGTGDEWVDPARGLYVDLPAYGVHMFEVAR